MATMREESDVADQEHADLSKRLKYCYPGNDEVSILLYQPIAVSEGVFGRLVDVGPRPPDASDGLVFQAANSGRTGDFLGQEDAPHKFVPTAQGIGQLDIESYEELNTLETRAQQVALEKLRYPHLSWSQRSVPPLNAIIHHTSLAPRPISLHPRRIAPAKLVYRYPNLGVVYTIEAPNCPEPNMMSKRIILYSLEVGDKALEVRFSTLLGTRRRETAKRLVKGNHYERPRLLHLVGTLILCHHWFYPYDAVAFAAIDELAPSAEQVYKWHGYQAPTKPKLTGRTFSEVFDTLCSDIEQLLLYMSHAHEGVHRRTSPISEAIREATATMLMLMAGQVMNFSALNNVLKPATNYRKTDLIVVAAPHSGLLGQPVWLPVFECNEVKSNIHRRHKNSHHALGLGEVDIDSRWGYINPRYYVTAIGESYRVGAWAVNVSDGPSENGSIPDSWIHDYGRRMAEFRLD